jgi:hypothetical protein
MMGSVLRRLAAAGGLAFLFEGPPPQAKGLQANPQFKFWPLNFLAR